jgi:hypothetical protein
MGLGSGIRDPRSEIRDPGPGIWKKPIHRIPDLITLAIFTYNPYVWC